MSTTSTMKKKLEFEQRSISDMRKRLKNLIIHFYLFYYILSQEIAFFTL
jgi:hypothetical protein